jgi:hypothetical protein
MRPDTTAIYQIDEVSALLGLLRRAAVSYLHGDLIEQFNLELDRLCPPVWEMQENGHATMV